MTQESGDAGLLDLITARQAELPQGGGGRFCMILAEAGGGRAR